MNSIENSTEVLRREIAEAEQRAELRRQEEEAQHARWLIEQDQREIARSIKESREQLDQVIKSWSTAIGIEQLFKGVEERASDLSEEQRKGVIDRLQLARGFIGTQDPLDFFRSWKAPKSDMYHSLGESQFSES